MIFGSRAVHFRGNLAKGRIEGSIAVSKGTSALVRIDSADIEELPFLKASGIQGKGLFYGNLVFAKNSGNLKFDVKDARLNTASFGGIGIPLDIFRSAQGAMTISGPVIRITSFSLRGPGIYARLKGNINGNQLNAVLELMPEPALEKENVIFSLIGTYRTSPGYYSIPVTKTLE
jgi:type II secretion system protein N